MWPSVRAQAANCSVEHAVCKHMRAHLLEQVVPELQVNQAGLERCAVEVRRVCQDVLAQVERAQGCGSRESGVREGLLEGGQYGNQTHL